LGPWWFPQLLWIHLAQTFVALLGNGAFRFVAQPLHGVVEVDHGAFLGALAFADQAGEGGCRVGKYLVQTLDIAIIAIAIFLHIYIRLG
jgi:hypothetical protein